MIWNKEMECADRETMRALQLKKLKETVRYEYDNVPYYREKMDKAGVKPEDIQTLEDIRKLPFITKEDIAVIAMPSFGGAAPQLALDRSACSGRKECELFI